MRVWMRRLVLGLVLLLGLGILALWRLAAALPREHVATSSAHLDPAPERVWEALTDLERIPEWREGIADIVLLSAPDELPRWRETNDWGVFELVTLEREPARRLVVEAQDPGGQFGGTWTYVLQPEAGGTRLTITERGYIASRLARVIGHYVMDPHRTMDIELRALGTYFGQTVRVEHLAPGPAERSR